MGSRTPVIPRPTDTFIGRAAELRAVESLLAAHRLVTLTGGAGIGKTRLALRIAEERAASAEGVTFVELVETRDPALVPRLVAAALGLRQSTLSCSLRYADRGRHHYCNYLNYHG